MLVTVDVRQEQQGASGCKRRELQRRRPIKTNGRPKEEDMDWRAPG